MNDWQKRTWAEIRLDNLRHNYAAIRAVLHMPGGNDLVINAPRKSDKAIYVKGVKLNGQKITDWKLTHKQLIEGGTLDFTMSARK